MEKNKINFILLSWAIIVMICLSLFPFVFEDKNHKVNHGGLIFLLWSMSASFIKGIGFIPKNFVLRIIFSTTASIITAIIGFIILFI